MLSPTASAQGLPAIPGTQTADQIRAQAAMLEAQARARLLDAETRKLNSTITPPDIRDGSNRADADLGEIKDWLEIKRTTYLQTWQDLEQRIEKSRQSMVKDRATRVIMWKNMIEQDDLRKIRGAIRSGNLINRIFMEVNAATGLTSASTIPSVITDTVTPLSTETLQALQFSRASQYGPVAISLENNMPQIFECWPYAFYHDALQPQVAMVTSAAKNIFGNQNDRKRRFELEKIFHKELRGLENAFLQVYPRQDRRTLPTVEIRRILAAEDFLIEIERLVRTRAETNLNLIGEMPSYFSSYPSEERNLLTLIQYTQRYGLEVTPAILGTEHVYDTLYFDALALADALNVAPTDKSIADSIINLDLDAAVSDPSDARK